MKRIFTVLAITLSITFVCTTGCVKDPTGVTDVVKEIPDLANFVVTAERTFISGAATAIQIASSSMADGDYTVNFSLTGSNTYSGSANMNFTGGHGTFNTPVLANGGNTNIVINSIANSSGGSATPSANNTSSFFDSTGTMNGTIQLADPFYATDVYWSQTNTLMTVEGVMWDPLRTVDVTLYNFSVANLPYTLVFHSLADGGAISYSDPSASDLRTAAHGKIVITSIGTGNIMNGTYEATMGDSSTISGTFACKKH